MLDGKRTAYVMQTVKQNGEEEEDKGKKEGEREKKAKLASRAGNVQGDAQHGDKRRTHSRRRVLIHTFKPKGKKGEKVPVGYTQITCHLIFDLK